jgi:hypothetical protein
LRVAEIFKHTVVLLHGLGWCVLGDEEGSAVCLHASYVNGTTLQDVLLQVTGRPDTLRHTWIVHLVVLKNKSIKHIKVFFNEPSFSLGSDLPVVPGCAA